MKRTALAMLLVGILPAMAWAQLDEVVLPVAKDSAFSNSNSGDPARSVRDFGATAAIFGTNVGGYYMAAMHFDLSTIPYPIWSAALQTTIAQGVGPGNNELVFALLDHPDNHAWVEGDGDGSQVTVGEASGTYSQYQVLPWQGKDAMGAVAPVATYYEAILSTFEEDPVNPGEYDRTLTELGRTPDETSLSQGETVQVAIDRDILQQYADGGGQITLLVTTNTGDWLFHASKEGAVLAGQDVAPRLIIQPPLGGDTDLSGTVDLADLAVLATNWNQAGDWYAGDFTGDDNVDLADLAILATNWNQSVAGDFAAAAAELGLPVVPEPATLSLLGLGLAALLRRRRA